MNEPCSTKKRKNFQAFTLIELLITLMIIGILAIIAIPSYMRYTRKSYYSEIVKSIAPYKVAVAACYNKMNNLADCDGGTNNIPPNRTSAAGGIASLTVVNGIITVTPVAQHGILATDLYILTPTSDATTGVVTWLSSGQAVTKGYAS